MGIRIMVKGGVWKNSEDEILKAAVMKYGLNQWPRVASLLNRKSAAQCKGRWYEWLDPAIKKTEWTREEEEKLLHLAKILPAQWRTIAPIVGRTPAQCLEHYERLLDAAQQRSGDMESGEMKDDPRKLRPGEIDPAPETKPARPDPIDMDEDEKEMLSEARARLANTKGKKAKRKAREKMLMEAKRLASLQKRRELKAAGLELKMREKKRKYIDYGREIPFQRTAPAGFYATGDEKLEGQKQALDPRFEALRVDKMEAERRDEEENRMRNQDKKRHKKLVQESLPQMVQALNQLNDPASIRRRVPLSLPAPQVTDSDLEEIVKLGGAHGAGVQGGEGVGATAGLLGDYRERNTPLATPMRTPRTAPGQDVIMQEARNLLAMRAAETPLKGGEAVMGGLEEGTGFEGHEPRSVRGGGKGGKEDGGGTMTPLSSMGGGKTPLMGGGGGGGRGGGRGPGSVSSASTMRSRAGGMTPMRDELGLNQGGGGSGMEQQQQLMVMGEKRRQKMLRAQLAEGLQGLPEPQYNYEISLPELEEDGEGGKEDGMSVEEDAADRDAREAGEKRAKEEAELARRSTVLKRGLPRPIVVDPQVFQSRARATAAAAAEGDEKAAADALVQKELYAMLVHDQAKYPFVHVALGKKKGGKSSGSSGSSNGGGVDLPALPSKLLEQARALVEEEVAASRKNKNEMVNGGDGGREGEREDDDPVVVEEAWLKAYHDLAYFPNRQTFGRLTGANKQDRLAALIHQFDSLQAQGVKEGKKAGKLEARLNLATGGYGKRASNLVQGVSDVLNQIDEMRLEVGCFRRLAAIEELALRTRLAKVQGEVEGLEGREEQLQVSYVELLDERDGLFALVGGRGEEGINGREERMEE
ncbi:hypothetical protein VYU27_001253 [Nannochloropsis oceanica]